MLAQKNWKTILNQLHWGVEPWPGFTVQHIGQPDTNSYHACTWLTDHPASSAWCYCIQVYLRVLKLRWMEIWSHFQDHSDKCCNVPVNSELEISWAICNSCTVSIIQLENFKLENPHPHPAFPSPLKKRRVQIMYSSNQPLVNKVNKLWIWYASNIKMFMEWGIILRAFIHTNNLHIYIYMYTIMTIYLITNNKTKLWSKSNAAKYKHRFLSNISNPPISFILYIFSYMDVFNTVS